MNIHVRFIASTVGAAILIFTAAAGESPVAATNAVPKAGAKISASERAKLIRKKLAKPSGGLIEKKIATKVIAIRDLQSDFTPGEVEAAVGKMRRLLYFPICRVTAGDKRTDIGAEVILEKTLPIPGTSVLAAPEQGFARVSSAYLLSDSPSAEKRQRRLYMALLRGMSMALGAGVAMYQPCIMTTVRSLADLDAIRMEVPGPETINNIERATKALGIERLFVVTYRTACRQGWAPAPTNDLQKAIWEEERKLPEKPLTIEFDPKKGK